MLYLAQLCANDAGRLNLAVRRVGAFPAPRCIRAADTVLLHDSNQQDDGENRRHAQINMAGHQQKRRSNAGRWRRRKNGDRMNGVFVEDSRMIIDDLIEARSAAARRRAKFGRLVHCLEHGDCGLPSCRSIRRIPPNTISVRFRKFACETRIPTDVCPPCLCHPKPRRS